MLTRRRFVGGLAALALTPLASAQQQITREQLSALLRDGSPTGWRVVEGYQREGTSFGSSNRQVTVPKGDLWPLAVGRPMTELLTAANTLVHETCHFYSYVQALGALSGIQGVALFPDVQSRLMVVNTETFPCREAVACCPDFLRATDRYRTYFDVDSPNLGTQKNGIYGLLEELGAYFCGTSACLELLTHLTHHPRAFSEGLSWGQFLVDPMGTMEATLEFRGYILAYLDYARTAHPKIYAQLLANRQLWRGYHAIQAAHSNLAEDYFRQLPTLAGRVGARVKGDHVDWNQQRFAIKKVEFRRLQSRLDACPSLRAMEETIQALF